MSWHPVPDRAAARVLGDALRRVGFTEDAVIDLLGEDAYGLTRDDVPVGVRRLPDSRLGTVLRAVFLQQPVPAEELGHAIGRAAVEALATTGLADVGDEVALHGRIVPVGDLYVTSDDFPGEDAEKDPPDFVAAYTPTSKLCDALTPRGPVERALDIGTGSGVQAMLSARQAREVVATDINPRALAFAELNAALNGFTNIECRLGSLFEPVEGETFDVITSNAPFVVSPENRWAYRDGGLDADNFSELIVREAIRHLSEDGYATLLVSWVAEDEDDSEARPLAWTDESGCDSWILPIYALDPLDHAVRWNIHLAGQAEPFGQVIDVWTRYLDELGVEVVTEGAVLLHKRAGKGHTARVDIVDDDLVDHAGDQIKRAFDARARLVELDLPGGLLAERLSLAGHIRLERELDADGGRPAEREALVQIAEGMHLGVEVEPQLLELVAALDGTATLGETIDQAVSRLELSTTDGKRLRREALGLVRALLELGALRFA
jgi:methylase of polypeptide subunit release factors